MTDTHVIVQEFFDAADALRAAFEEHFANPSGHSEIHQVWNYWYVPDTYNYLRTSAGKVIPEPLLARFMNRLNAWALDQLGLSTRLNPWLSVYFNGCGQTLHNDADNGQMGYVYSITRWDERTFVGGETILFRQENYWETDRLLKGGAETAFYEKVPSRFNQLLVFDDRMIHGVRTVQGTMDPVAGRVVLHGHLSADSVALQGALTPEASRQALAPLRERLGAVVREHNKLVHGFVTLRLSVDPDGRVTAVRPLCDRLLPMSPDRTRVVTFRQQVTEFVSAVRFPSSSGATEVTLPIRVGA